MLSSKHKGSKFAFGLGFRALKCIKQHKTTVFTVFSGVLLSKIKFPYGPMKQFLFDVVEPPSPSASECFSFLGFPWLPEARCAEDAANVCWDRVGHELVIVPARKVHDKGREEAGLWGQDDPSILGFFTLIIYA